MRPSLLLMLGVLVAPWSLPTAASAAPPEPVDQVTLRSGDVLRGTVLERGPTGITFDHPELGPISIGTDKIAAVGPIAPDRQTPAELVAAAAEEEARLEADRARLSDWRFAVSMALAGSFNVNDEVSVRIGASATRETEHDRSSAAVEYYFRSLNSGTTDNNLLANALQEWYLRASAWLVFGQGTYQYDQFQSWEHRISAYGGVGYRLIRSQPIDLTLRLGAGATYEFGTDEWIPQLLLAESLAWRIDERQRFTLDAGVAPDVRDFADILLTVQAEYSLAIGPTGRGLALTAGVRNIYDSKPPEDSTSNDLRVYTGLRYDF